ncbi:MAG TPA: ABC transporter permease [Bacteroidota bacterium]|nr:ABC transporter permease [Bacteroidota bacterium]
MLRRLRPIIIKEFRQIRRDQRVLAILTLFPVLLMLLNGYALNSDVQHVRMAVYDDDRSAESREFMDSFVTSGYFDYVAQARSSAEAAALLNDGGVRLAVIIPANFSHDLLSGRSPEVQVLVDGMDANYATTIIGYVQAIALDYSQAIVLKSLARLGLGTYIPVRYEARIWYNPELKSAKFLVPGLIGFVLAITAVIATSLSIVKEKERNTIEQIDVSPISPLELIVGKLIPYVLISLVAAALVLTAGYFMFDVAIKGSLLLLFFTTLLFIMAALSIGLWVSAVAETQMVAFQLAALLATLPTMMFSGFMFPLRSMPWWIQALSNITPAKYYLIILRGIILKGVGLSAWWPQVVYLAAFTTVVLFLSIRRFRKTIA